MKLLKTTFAIVLLALFSSCVQDVHKKTISVVQIYIIKFRQRSPIKIFRKVELTEISNLLIEEPERKQ